MQQQTSPTPGLVPTMAQFPAVQPTATTPRDPMEYTQTNFPALTPRQLAALAQLEVQDQQALRSSARNVLQPSLQTMAGRPLPSQDRSRSHTRPQHRRRRRSRSHRRDRRSRSHGARRAHRHRPRTPIGPDPQAVTAVTGPLCYAADPSSARCQYRTWKG